MNSHPPPPPPLPREARKLWRFIKLLWKEDDLLYRSLLLIFVWIQFLPLPRKFWRFIKLLEKVEDSLNLARLLILVWMKVSPPRKARNFDVSLNC